MPPKPKPGECIVVVVDVGPKTRLGLPTEQTFFHQSKTCLVNILQRKIFADKCTDQVGIVLFGTDDTDNLLNDGGGEYENISVLREPRFVDWGTVSAAEELPRGSCSADWLDALVVAVDLLHAQKQEYTSKKIVLLTDFSGDFSDDKTGTIISTISNYKIDLSVIGPGLSDGGGDSGAGNDTNGSSGGMSWSGKPKTTVQLAAEALVANIVDSVDGMMCSFEEAIPQLIFFQKKTSGSANWNALLDIGEDFVIPVTGRIKMKRALVDTWKRCHATDDTAVVIKEKSYHKQDEQQTVVDEEDVIDGYRYGTTLVPFSEEDRQLSYSSGAEKSALSVLGFTRTEHCSLPQRAGDQVVLVTAKDGDEQSAVALSSLIQALAELDMVAITRRVYRKGAVPVMGALYPHITPQSEFLVWVALPYQEDVRILSFPSLRRYTEALTDQQTEAMDCLIDAMNLNTTDEDGDVNELLEPSCVLNPHLQHYYNCLTDRAINPGRPLPQPQGHVTDILCVPDEVREALDGIADRLLKWFPTTKIVRRTKRERDNIFDTAEDGNTSKRSREDEDDAEGVSISVEGRVTQVTTATPVQDFTAMINQQPHKFIQICQQLVEVLLQLVETMSGAASSPAEQATADKIINCLKVFRKESVVIAPEAYNKFLHRLKQLAVGRGLEGSLWQSVGQQVLGLITATDTLQSSVTEDEAREFLKLQDDVMDTEQRPQPPPVQDEDYDDLLDDL